MMVRDLSNLRQGPQRSSFSRDDRDEGGTLKSLMSNLLPSLDASMDSQFSKDDMTATTAYQTSYTTSFSSSFGHDDLCESSDEEDNMSVSTSSRFRAQGAKVKQSLKKAFNKMAKKSTTSLNTASTGGSSGKKTTSKKSNDKKLTNKLSSKKDPLALDGSSESRHFIDDVSIDTFVDPPICAAAPFEEPQSLLPQHEHQSDDQDREKPQRRQSRSQARPNIGAGAKSRSRSPSDRGESESSESNRHRSSHSRAASSKRSSGPKGKKEELKRRRSSRRGGGAGKPSSTGKRLPPKAKSYDCQRSNPPGLTPMGELIASGGGESMEKPKPIRRSSSFASVGRDRPRNPRSSVTAQAAIPNPRPSMSAHRRSSNMTKQPTASGSAHRRRSGDGNKSAHRTRSLKHANNNEGHEQHSSSHSTRKSTRRTKSFGKQGELTDAAKPTGQRPSRAKSFDGCTNMEPIRASQRRRSISVHKREAKRKSASAASRQQDSYSDSYSSLHASFNGDQPPPLFSLMDHFGGSTHTTTTVETKFDEVSIDTCTTAEAAKNIASKGAERQRSKSRSVSPSRRQRSKSRSRSPSEGRHKKREERERSVSRRSTSTHDRGRPQCQKQSRRPSAVARDRSKSVSRRNSSEKRTRSRSRSRRNSSVERDTERSRSQSRRPSVKVQTRGRSKSIHRRPSQSQQPPLSTPQSKRRSISAKRRPSVQRSRSSSRSRRESAAKSMKKYETLSKEDIMQPKDKASEKGRRARSASRSKNSSKSRVSRSLSSTRKNKEQQEGIGNYLQRQQEQTSPRIEEDANSQSTGSKTTESNEVTYATPSWMWNQSSSAASFNSAFFNAHQEVSSSSSSSNWASFGPVKEESSNGDDGQSFFQTSFTSNSYDADSSETSSAIWSTPKAASALDFPNTTGGNGISPPLLATSKSASSLSTPTGDKGKQSRKEMIKEAKRNSSRRLLERDGQEDADPLQERMEMLKDAQRRASNGASSKAKHF